MAFTVQDNQKMDSHVIGCILLCVLVDSYPSLTVRISLLHKRVGCEHIRPYLQDPMKTPNPFLLALSLGVSSTLVWFFSVLLVAQIFGFHHWLPKTMFLLIIPLPFVVGWVYIRRIKRQNAIEIEKINKHWGWQDE